MTLSNKKLIFIFIFMVTSMIVTMFWSPYYYLLIQNQISIETAQGVK